MSILHSSARPSGASRRSREDVAARICAARPSSASRYVQVVRVTVAVRLQMWLLVNVM